METVKRLSAGLAVLAVPFALWAVASNPPTEGGWYPPCMFNVTTGLHCPGCGGTRALHLVSNGRVIEALGQNALLFALLPFAIWYLSALGVYALTGRWRQPWFKNRKVAVALAILVIGYGVLRNIPVFDFLAPKPL